MVRSVVCLWAAMPAISEHASGKRLLNLVAARGKAVPKGARRWCSALDQAGGAQGAFDCRAAGFAEFGERQAQRATAQAETGHGPLQRNRVGLDEQVAVQRHELELDFHRPLDVARQRGHAQFVHLARRDVGRDADVALAAAQHERDRGRVVAGVHGKVLRQVANEPLGAFDVAGGFLDADDAGHLRQAQHGVVRHIGHGAPGHVVEHHGQVAHGLGDGLEVLVLAFLRRLVVVGHDLQLRIGAHALGELGELDGFLGRIGAAAGHDGHASLGLLDGYADDFAVLLDIDRRRLAGGPDHAEAVGAFFDVPIDEPPQGGVVDTAVVVHRRDERDDAACQLLQGESLCRWTKAPILLTPAPRQAVAPAPSVSLEQVARGLGGGGLCGAHGGNALHEARRVLDETVFIGHHAQAGTGRQ
jgi:hypothetical protein